MLKKNLKKCCIDKNIFWLLKGTYQVLSIWGIDGCFFSDARVNHSQKCSRNLGKANVWHAKNESLVEGSLQGRFEG